MLYRENGQFKTSYRADQAIFPIAQDRIAIALMLAVAFLVVPMLASDYIFRAILIPFVIMALAALGVNILVGYCGQISLGSGAFMAVGAYGAYNFFVRIPGLPLIPALILGGLCATFFGILFGLPSLRVKGLYLAVATLAAQFFSDWMFLRIKWFTNNSDSGSVSVNNLQVFGIPIDSAMSKYIFCLALLVVAHQFQQQTEWHLQRSPLAKQKIYLDVALSMGIPSTCKLLTDTEPESELLVNHLMRRNIQSLKNCAASVATARYKPLTRKLGKPNKMPKKVAHRPPKMSAGISGKPGKRTKKLKAP